MKLLIQASKERYYKLQHRFILFCHKKVAHHGVIMMIFISIIQDHHAGPADYLFLVLAFMCEFSQEI